VTLHQAAWHAYARPRCECACVRAHGDVASASSSTARPAACPQPTRPTNVLAQTWNRSQSLMCTALHPHPPTIPGGQGRHHLIPTPSCHTISMCLLAITDVTASWHGGHTAIGRQAAQSCGHSPYTIRGTAGLTKSRPTQTSMHRAPTCTDTAPRLGLGRTATSRQGRCRRRRHWRGAY